LKGDAGHCISYRFGAVEPHTGETHRVGSGSPLELQANSADNLAHRIRRQQFGRRQMGENRRAQREQSPFGLDPLRSGIARQVIQKPSYLFLESSRIVWRPGRDRRQFPENSRDRCKRHHKNRQPAQVSHGLPLENRHLNRAASPSVRAFRPIFQLEPKSLWSVSVSRIRLLTAVAAIVAISVPLQAAPPALIEVQVAGETLQGRVFAHNDRRFWLQTQDGRMRSLPADGVKNLRKISAQFSGWSSSIVRENLRREFGKGFEVAGTRHYAVCAKSDQKARLYAETFEELYRTFQMYFSLRGFSVSEPEFPLVAIVFPDFESFARYARTERVDVPQTLRGYYMPASNRIALYESPENCVRQSQLPPARGFSAGQVGMPGDSALSVVCAQSPWIEDDAWATFQGSLKDTMIHEGTHQIAFNTGLHSRIGANPRWVVEGLATVFEAPGVRNSGSSGPARTRINHERFVTFGNYSKARYKPKSLESFLSGDELFQTSVFDAYGEAWALSFFLIETRPRAYADFLRTIAARDPLRAYPAEERVADFKNTISKELPLLEAEFLRFVAAIK